MENSAKKAGITVSVMMFVTLLSKGLGMLRQMLTTSIFAAGMEGIAFSAASKIPFAVFDILFAAAILGSFLPIYRGKLTNDEPSSRRFSSSFFTCVILITLLISSLGILLSKPILLLAAPNLDDETAALASLLLKIMFPSMVFAGAAYTLIGILQSHEKFILPAAVSSISNLFILIYLMNCKALSDREAVIGLAISYLFSWLLQFLTLAFPLMRMNRLPRLHIESGNEELRLSLRRSVPIMFGSWLMPMGLLIANFFSSFVASDKIDPSLTSGAAIVVFETAFSVFSIVTGLFTYGVCNYIFPKLSEKNAKKDNIGFRQALHRGMLASLVLTLPVAASVWILAQEGLSILYLHGNFTEALVLSATSSLKMLALSVPFVCLSDLLSRAFYACGKVRYPTYAALIGIAVNILICYAALLFDSLSVSVVALACAIGQITASLALMLFSFRLFGRITHSISRYVAFLIPCSAAISAVSMVFLRHILKKKLANFSIFENFVIIALVFLVGIVVYLICIMGVKIFMSRKK